MTSKAHQRYRRKRAWRLFCHRLFVFLLALVVWFALLGLLLLIDPNGYLGRLPH